MLGKMTYFICFALLLGTASSVQALVTVTTAVGNGADTGLENDGQGGDHGPDSVHGTDADLDIRNYEGVRQKFICIRFDLTGIESGLSDATLSITVNISNRNRNWLVYGLVDESLDIWDEATTSYSNAPGILPAALGSFALDDTKLQLLGTLGVSENGPTRETPNIYTSITTELDLTSFLQSDTNKLVTFVVINENSDSSASYYVATKEGDPTAAPTLTLPNATLSAAMNPNPANKVDGVVRDGVVLSWAPSESAISHDVYFGDDPNIVSNADRTNPMGVLLIEGQDPNTFALDRLNFNHSYYWRIDEVSGTPDPIYRGQVWSFTTEPLVIPIPGASITAKASSSVEGKGPENTVNGSGLDETGLLHGNIGDGTMWLSSRDGEQPTWIEYDLGKVYKLHEIWVWNSNDGMETSIGIGFKEVLIEYSADGAEFVTLGTTHEFTQAPGDPNYTHNTTVDMGGIAARHIRLTANSNWFEMLGQYSLSEVRFFYVPVQARVPKPASGETGVALDVTLDWTAGREAAEHNVYLDTSEQAVIDDTAFVDAVTEVGYGPLSLNYGTTYYWRVDEVNDLEDPNVVEGDIWSFTTKEFLVINDFELYDSNDNQIWWAWKDGLGYVAHDNEPAYPGNGTGSEVGDGTTGSYTEETIVHGGSQSMPYWFDNNKQGFNNYSEAELKLTAPRNWTEGGIAELSLWFRGNPASVGSFVEGPVGTYTMTGSGADIWSQSDEFHYAFKTLSGQGSIQARVESLTDTHSSAKAAVMIRETLAPDSKYWMAAVRPGSNGVIAEYRAETGQDAQQIDSLTGITAPYWVKIERDIGGNFTAYSSVDGFTWQILGFSEPIQMDTNVNIGLAVTSHDAALTCQAAFSNVTTTGSVGALWTNQDIGIASNDPEPLYVAVSNSAGAPAVLVHDDPAVTHIATWTEWIISLQDLADRGLNLTDVDSIAIGVGTRGNMTAPGGSGKMFFDDFRLYGPREIIVEE